MGERLRVVSFNVRTSRGNDGWNRWVFRRASCVAAIRAVAADVIALQEVRPDALRYLRRAFPDHAVAGRGRDRDGGGEYAAVLVGGGWTLESHDTRWLSPTPDLPGSVGWDAGLARIATLARLRRGSTALGIANTHFDSRGRLARARSSALLLDWLSAEPERPWVITGDLNARPDSAPVRALTGAGFTDPFPLDAGGTEHGFTGRSDRNRIDFVLAGPGVTVTAAEIVYARPGGRMPSDHWPVVADLEVGN